MNTMITVSLLVNVLVLVPVCGGLLADTQWVGRSLGAFTPARGILLAMYLTILVMSAGLLFMPDIKFVSALLLVQVIYKLTTPVTVRTFRNPVVISNLAISVLHVGTLTLIWQSVS